MVSRNAPYLHCLKGELIYLGSPTLGRVNARALGANYCGPITVASLMKERDHHTVDYVSYSQRTVSGLFNVPQNLYAQALRDGTYGLSSLSE